MGACVGREVEGDGRAGMTGAGTSSTAAPSSRTDGSEGGGPSFAHLRDSYLERMYESILLGKKIQHIFAR